MAADVHAAAETFIKSKLTETLQTAGIDGTTMADQDAAWRLMYGRLVNEFGATELLPFKLDLKELMIRRMIRSSGSSAEAAAPAAAPGAATASLRKSPKPNTANGSRSPPPAISAPIAALPIAAPVGAQSPKPIAAEGKPSPKLTVAAPIAAPVAVAVPVASHVEEPVSHTEEPEPVTPITSSVAPLQSSRQLTFAPPMSPLLALGSAATTLLPPLPASLLSSAPPPASVMMLHLTQSQAAASITDEEDMDTNADTATQPSAETLRALEEEKNAEAARLASARAEKEAAAAAAAAMRRAAIKAAADVEAEEEEKVQRYLDWFHSHENTTVSITQRGSDLNVGGVIQPMPNISSGNGGYRVEYASIDKPNEWITDLPLFTPKDCTQNNRKFTLSPNVGWLWAVRLRYIVDSNAMDDTQQRTVPVHVRGLRSAEQQQEYSAKKAAAIKSMNARGAATTKAVVPSTPPITPPTANANATTAALATVPEAAVIPETQPEFMGSLNGSQAPSSSSQTPDDVSNASQLTVGHSTQRSSRRTAGRSRSPATSGSQSSSSSPAPRITRSKAAASAASTASTASAETRMPSASLEY